jgi:hypothetical protein
MTPRLHSILDDASCEEWRVRTSGGETPSWCAMPRGRVESLIRRDFGGVDGGVERWVKLLHGSSTERMINL